MENFAFYQKSEKVLEIFLPYFLNAFIHENSKNILKNGKAVLFLSHVCCHITKIDFQKQFEFLKFS